MVPGTLITDCKAFYDGVVMSVSAGLGLDERRTAIEALALRQAFEAGGTVVRWVHSHAQLADGLTKASQQALNVIMSSGIKRQITATMRYGNLQFWKFVHNPIINQGTLRHSFFQWLTHCDHLIMRPHPGVSAPGRVNKDRSA